MYAKVVSVFKNWQIDTKIYFNARLKRLLLQSKVGYGYSIQASIDSTITHVKQNKY